MDLFFRPFHAVNAAWPLAAVSIVAGVFAMLVFRFASNQRAMRRTRNHIQANILAVRLYPDQLGVVLRSYFRVFRYTLLYLAYTLRPVLILFLPMALLLSQLNLRFSRKPMSPGDSFILKAKLARSISPEAPSLRLPRGLRLTSPPVHIPALREVDWMIQADEKGDFWPAVAVAGGVFTKRVVVSGNLTSLYAKRERNNWLNWVLNPGGRILPAPGPLRSIEVNYPRRAIDLGPFEVEWWIFFFIVAIASGLVAKTFLKVEL